MANSLEPRLLAVAHEIASRVHADIGSDHALLPEYLLRSGRAERVLVVEKNPTPFENSRRALQGLNAQVRLGDGLGPLHPGEADSLSLSGMGAKLMVQILSQHPHKIPPRVVLQPNDSPEPLRLWAREAGFHLLREQMVEGFWRYSILSFGPRPGPDPAYGGVPLEAALRYGPLLMHHKHPLLLQELKAQRHYFQKLGPATKGVQEKLAVLEAALEYCSSQTSPLP